MSLSKSGVRGQRGVAMVEFTIALPLLLLLLLGVAEFGRMLFQYNSLLQASRDAGRYAASNAWNATLGEVDLTTALKGEIENVAVYGVPCKPLDDVECGALTEDECDEPRKFCPVVAGLTPGDVIVQESATDDRYIEVSITYSFQPVVGSVLPSFFGDGIPLAVELTSTIVMRAL